MLNEGEANLSRRKLLIGSTVAATAILLAACSNSGPPPTSEWQQVSIPKGDSGSILDLSHIITAQYPYKFGLRGLFLALRADLPLVAVGCVWDEREVKINRGRFENPFASRFPLRGSMRFKEVSEPFNPLAAGDLGQLNTDFVNPAIASRYGDEALGQLTAGGYFSNKRPWTLNVKLRPPSDKMVALVFDPSHIEYKGKPNSTCYVAARLHFSD